MIATPNIGIFLGRLVSESDILLLQGVADYTRSAGAWRFTYSAGMDMPVLSQEDLATWHGDGILTTFREHPLISEQIAEGIPVVGMPYRPGDLPWQVIIKRSVCGVLGARHLLDQGYHSFAILFDALTPACGVDEAFIKTLESQGISPIVARVPEQYLTPEERRPWCRDWLRSLEQPVGIMAAKEILGLELLDLCMEMEINVPNDMGILSVSPGRINSDARPISMSRIKEDLVTVGYQAAQMLGQLLRGETPPDNPLWIIPDSVVLRESTNRQHPEDNIVNKALHYIQTNADRRISVGDVVQSCGVSRSTLKKRFRGQIDRSISEAIRSAHIERAKFLLRTTDLGIGRIAPACGFSESSRLFEAFKRTTGMTPLEFRKEHEVPS